MVKIIFHKDKCIGCGACAATCPDNWEVKEQDGEFKAKPKKTELEEVGCNKEAAEGCPVQAIEIKE